MKCPLQARDEVVLVSVAVDDHLGIDETLVRFSEAPYLGVLGHKFPVLFAPFSPHFEAKFRVLLLIMMSDKIVLLVRFVPRLAIPRTFSAAGR